MTISPNFYKHISVGIVHWMAYPESRQSEEIALKTIRKLAGDDFFTALEIGPVGEGIRNEVKKILETSHVKRLNIGGAGPLTRKGLDLASLDEEKRKTSVEFSKTLIDEAYFFEAQSLMLATGPDPGEPHRDKGKKQFVQSLKELCAYAEKKAKDKLLTITFEYFDRELDKKRLIGPTREAVEIAEVVVQSHSNCGLTVDQSHLPQLGENPRTALETAKKHIRHVHLANCVVTDKTHPFFGDQHPPFGIAGGEVDVPEVAEFLLVLEKVGYLSSGELPIVSCEVTAGKGGDAELAIANAKRTIRQAWLRAFP